MKLSENTVLITGGSEGVGLALARALIANNRVIVCGRSEEKLRRAKAQLPGLHTEVCDVTDAAQRDSLLSRLRGDFPELNLLINNAGGKWPCDLLDPACSAALVADMALNFTAPVALTSQLLPLLRERPRAAIVNITSGLVYLPKAEQAFYCAAKAALHSYSRSLRWALRDSAVSVCEVLLPLVGTNFHRGRPPRNLRAISAERAAELVLKGVASGARELRPGKSALARWLDFLAPHRGLAAVNG